MTTKLHLVVAFFSGLLFAVGLGISGMTQASKVIGFLDVSGDWDPSLGLVMGGAVAVGLLTTKVLKGMKAPLCGAVFCLPKKTAVDGRLLAGSALFGVGWGLGGICPGPGVVAAMGGALPVVVFVAAMLAGMGLYRAFDR